MSLVTALKGVAKRVLPAGVVGRLKATRTFQRWHYCERLRAAREEEEPELGVVKRIVAPGDLVVDAGANIGLYTKFLSRYAGPDGRVHSIEPIPRTFDLLRHNVRRLGWRNVTLHCCALSDAPGRALMEIPSDAAGVPNYYLSRLAHPRAQVSFGSIEVQVQTLDALLPAGARPSFIKMDVEGHELRCLGGALSILGRGSPAWLVEITSDPDDERSEAFSLFRLLGEKGYAAFRLDGTSLRRRRPGDSAVNHFFLTPQHMARLQAGGLRPV